MNNFFDKVKTMVEKIDSTDYNKSLNSITSIASFGKVSEKSLLKSLYTLFFDKNYDNKNSMYINLSKISAVKNNLTFNQQFNILSKIAEIYPDHTFLLKLAKFGQEGFLNDQPTITPQTDQKNPVNIDLEGNPSEINDTDDQVAPEPTNQVNGYTLEEKDGLYRVVNDKDATIKEGLTLEAALKVIALSEEDKVELKDEQELEKTPASSLESEPTAEETKEHKNVQEVNVNTGVETKVEEKPEDRANDFSSRDFFDMFRKLDENTANTVLEKIREKVSGETGAEAYNFLLKVKDNNWDFTATYKETADGQSKQEVESERKEQSKKLARSIEKIIEEDAELSKMLGYKDYEAKKQDKTASLKVKALSEGDLFFNTPTKDFKLYINQKYLFNLINDGHKLEITLNPEDKTGRYEYNCTLETPIKWGINIFSEKFGYDLSSVEIPDQDISVDVELSIYDEEKDDTTEYRVSVIIPLKEYIQRDFTIKSNSTFGLFDLTINEDGSLYTESFY